MVTLKNTGRWPVAWVLLEDLLPRDALMFDPPRLRVNGRRVALTMLRAAARKTMLYQLTPTRRGYYQLGPAVHRLAPSRLSFAEVMRQRFGSETGKVEA